MLTPTYASIPIPNSSLCMTHVHPTLQHPKVPALAASPMSSWPCSVPPSAQKLPQASPGQCFFLSMGTCGWWRAMPGLGNTVEVKEVPRTEKYTSLASPREPASSPWSTSRPPTGRAFQEPSGLLLQRRPDQVNEQADRPQSQLPNMSALLGFGFCCSPGFPEGDEAGWSLASWSSLTEGPPHLL